MQERVPKNIGCWFHALLLLAIFYGIVFSPFLFGGWSFLSVDAHYTNYPLLTLFKDRYLTGDFIWNDLNFHGFPMGLGFSFCFHLLLYPLIHFLSPISTLHWGTMLYITFGAFFFCLLLRRLKCSFYASLLGATLYGLGAWAWIFDLTISAALLTFPLLILCIIENQKKPIAMTILGSILIGAIWLMVHLQFAVILITCGGIIALVISMKEKNGFKSLMLFMIMAMVGTLIGLVRTLPIYAYGLLSPRTAMTIADASQGRTLGTSFPIQYFFPRLNLSFLSGTPDFSPYIGPVALLLVFVAIFTRFREPLTRFLVISYTLILILSLPNSPLYALLFHIPPFNFLRGATRWLLIANIIATTLAALGFDAVVKGAGDKTRIMISKFFVLLGSVAFAGAAAASAIPFVFKGFSGSISRSFDWRFARFAQDINPELQQFSSTMKEFTESFLQALGSGFNNQYGILEGNILFPLLALIIAGIGLGYAWKHVPKKRRPLFLLILNIITILPVFVAWGIRESVPRTIYETPSKTMQYLKDKEGMSFAFMPQIGLRDKLKLPYPETTDEEMQQATMAYIPASYNLYALLPSADLYDRIASKRMGRLQGAIGTRTASMYGFEEFSWSPIPIEEKLNILAQRHALLDILNITHVISMFSLEEVQLQKVFTEEVGPHRIPIYIYNNKTARPFAYFAQQVVLKEPDSDESYDFLINEKWPSTKTLIECKGCNAAKRFTADGIIDVTEKTPHKTLLRSYSPDEQWLILSQNYMPGWHVFVDEEEVSPALAHSTFFAINLTPGEHQVMLSFSYPQLMKDSIKLIRKPNESIWIN